MNDSENQLAITNTACPVAVSAPSIISGLGDAAAFAWDEYFAGLIGNEATRKAYLHAVRKFLAWCESEKLELIRITPGMVGRYFSLHKGSIPTKKQHMAAIRGLFNVLVQRHVVVLNPALTVKLPRFSAMEGKTPRITVEQARKLLGSIELNSAVDYRDRAILAVLIYTAVRVSAAANLRICDLVDEGTQYSLRFLEKGGKQKSIPVRHDLQEYLKQYAANCKLDLSATNEPVFRTTKGRTAEMTSRAMSGIDICRMMKRRLKAAGLPLILSPHSCRSCVATDLLAQGVALEDVQYLLSHSDARTTALYDRRRKQVTRNIVERISV